MTSSFQHPVSMQEFGESLAIFSLDRESVLFALGRLPDEPSINKVAIEYEIQLLKILSVGWAISYFMEDHSEKSPLVKKFWDVLFEFSKNLSSATSLTIGKEVDYFMALRERISEGPGRGPACQPTFARLCENTDNVHVIMAGNRIVHLSLEGVKHFLESVFSDASDSSPPLADSGRRYSAAEC